MYVVKEVCVSDTVKEKEVDWHTALSVPRLVERVILGVCPKTLFTVKSVVNNKKELKNNLTVFFKKYCLSNIQRK